MYNQASIYKGGGVYNLGDGASTKLAENTLRFLFSKSDYDPTVDGVGSSGTWQKVNTAAANVWDWTKSGTSFANAFENAFADSGNLVSVIAAGSTSAITSASNMFKGCSSLIYIALFDTSNVTNISSMFYGCSRLKNIPLFNFSKVTDMSSAFRTCYSISNIQQFDTSSVTNMSTTFAECSYLKNIPLFDTSKVVYIGNAFSGCTRVESGALALYQQMSTQTTPPSSHTDTFKNCGRDTTTGAAELAQIPTSWGGNAPATLNMGAPQNLTDPLSPSVIDDGDDSLTK